MNFKNIYKYLSASALILFLGSCDRDRNTTGWEYFDDMAHSPAYETYTPNPNFPDGKTMRNPVEGTIPIGYEPYMYQKTDEDRVKAGQELRNPLEANEQNIARGKEVYTVFCSSCHGETGNGQGHLFTSKKYNYQPASLLSDKVRTNPDGEIFHVITVGFGVMAPHGYMIRPDDRWKATMYIRNVLQQQQ
ncbi:MAG TPA: c-type cytochrome [Prolixibacteraceae bacterium]|nr:c-type cytochrome [Prolixibacteraceae bacterium]